MSEHDKSLNVIDSIVFPWIKLINIPEKINIPDNEISDGIRYLLVDQQINIETKELFYHVAFKIIAHTGLQNNSQFSVNFNPLFEEIFIHSINIIRDNEVIDKKNMNGFSYFSSESEHDRYIYNGTQVAMIHFDDVRLGDIIEYSYTKRGENPVYIGDFYSSLSLGFAVPVEFIYVRVIFNVNRVIRYQKIGLIDEPKESREGDIICWLWEKNQPKRIIQEDYVPSWYNPYPLLLMSEQDSWKDVADWANDLFRFDDEENPELSMTIDGIINSSENDGMKVQKVLRFIQNNIRYLLFQYGENAYRPNPPHVVFLQKFGDCKDKSILMVYMLRKMGIHADPVLINTYLREKISERNPSIHSFNHCVVKVKINDNEYMYDPTFSMQGGSYDRVYFPKAGKGLVVSPDTCDLSDIPCNNHSQIVVNETYDINTNDEPGRLEVETIYYGEDADRQRNIFSSVSISESEKRFLDYYIEKYKNVSTLKPMESYDNMDENTFKIIEKYSIANPWEIISIDPLQKNVTIFAESIRSMIRVPAVQKRTMPYVLAFPVDVRCNIEINFNEQWKMENESEDIHCHGIVWKHNAFVDGKQIKLSYQFMTENNYLEPDSIAEYVKLQHKIFRSSSYVFSHSEPRHEPVIEKKLDTRHWIAIGIIVGLMFLLRMILLFLKL